MRSVLVVADRPAAITIPHWSRSIAGFGDGGLRWCVTTWDRLGKIAAVQKATGTRSTSSSPTRRTWCGTRRPSGGSTGRPSPARAGSRTRPTCWPATATPAHTPLELPYLAPEFAARHGEPLQGVGRPAEAARRASGSTWNAAGTAGRGPRTPTSAAPTSARLQSWLADADPPATLHRLGPVGSGVGERHPGRAHARPSGPPTSRSGRSSAPRCSWPGARGRARKGRAALLRFRQKAGLIRVQATVDWVKAQVEAERQVAVSVEFVETAADPIREALLDAGVAVAVDLRARPLRRRGRAAALPARARRWSASSP